MELIFVWLSGMENLHITVLHSYSKPVSSWTPAQTEDLAAEVTLTEPAVLIFLLMVPSSGLEDWTTLSGPGTSGREDSSSNMTSAARSSVWAGVQLETGLL
jgi:hypothetical protein